MTGKQLKNSILQLAIQGKLVPQNPTDEPASALLQRIRKEKEQLVKEKKLKKKDLVTTPISDEEKPFEIPESWEWCRIGELFKTTSGSTPLSSNPLYYNGDINWTRTTDLNNGYLYSCERKVSQKAMEECKLSIIPQNSVCLAMYGGAGTIGKYSLIQFNTTINQSVCAIHPNGYCSMEYLLYFMQYHRPNWMDFAAGSRKDPNINKIIINNCLFPLPPLSEQHRIVAKIEELMPLVEEYDKAQTKLDDLNRKLPEALKKSILQEAIMGKLVPSSLPAGRQDPNDEPASALLQRIHKEKEQLVKEGKLKKKDLVTTPITDEEKPFEIPESWEWCRLGEISNLVTKGTTPRGGNVAYLDKGIGFLRAENVSNMISLDFSNLKYIDNETHTSYLKRSMLSENDLLITIAGSLGRTAIVKAEDLPLNMNQAISVVRFTDVNLIDLHFIALAINSPAIQEILLRKSKITAIPNLTLEIISDCLIPLPPLSEQRRIVAKIEELLGVLG